MGQKVEYDGEVYELDVTVAGTEDLNLVRAGLQEKFGITDRFENPILVLGDDGILHLTEEPVFG